LREKARILLDDQWLLAIDPRGIAARPSVQTPDPDVALHVEQDEVVLPVIIDGDFLACLDWSRGVVVEIVILIPLCVRGGRMIEEPAEPHVIECIGTAIVDSILIRDY
jgi:hypothetical protein